MPTLRHATADDAVPMARIQSAAMRHGGDEHYTEEQLKALATGDPGPDAIPDALFEDDDRRGIVVEDEGEVVGWGSVRLDDGVLAATFVDPDRTDEGIGRRIVERLEAEARDAGLDRLDVPASINAVGFYCRLGYEEAEEFDASAPDDPEVPAVRMTKRL